MSKDKEFLSTKEAAHMLGYHPTTLTLNRTKDRGGIKPPYYRLSPRRIVYKRSELEAWLRARHSAEWPD